jgi:hypothetical protein
LDVWRALNCLERWRFGMQTGRRIPAHDDDHWLCCYQYGLDPNWGPGSHDSVAEHPWPPAGRDDEW